MSKFEFDFTEEQVEELLHGNKEVGQWYEAMEEILPYYEINTVNRVAGFIAQCCHESNNFRVITENLNYSSKALDSIFGKYFVRAGRDSKPYHRQPEKIARLTNYSSTVSSVALRLANLLHILFDSYLQY